MLRWELVLAARAESGDERAQTLMRRIVDIDPATPLLPTETPDPAKDEFERVRAQALAEHPVPWDHLPTLLCMQGSRTAVYARTKPAAKIDRMYVYMTRDLSRDAVPLPMKSAGDHGAGLVWTAEVSEAYCASEGLIFYAFEGVDAAGRIHGGVTWYPLVVLPRNEDVGAAAAAKRAALRALDSRVWAPQTLESLLRWEPVTVHLAPAVAEH